MPEPFIKFVEVDLHDNRKTKVWAVLTIDGRKLLGQIEWYSAWRKYCIVYRPSLGQVTFEENCLQLIIDFCKSETSKHREMRKGRIAT